MPRRTTPKKRSLAADSRAHLHIIMITTTLLHLMPREKAREEEKGRREEDKGRANPPGRGVARATYRRSHRYALTRSYGAEESGREGRGG